MTVAEDIAKVYRKRILAQVKWWKDARVGLALSGGVDSCAILAAMLELHLNPVLISYTPDTHESTDFVMARATADNYSLRFVPVVLSTEPKDIEMLARTVMSFGWHSVVQVEAISPFVKIAGAARRNKVDVIFTGDGAYFALSRFAPALASKLGFGTDYDFRKDTTSERIDALRQDYYDHDRCCSGMLTTLFEYLSIDTCFPFRDEELFKASLGSTWREVNKPRQKEPTRIAFEEYWGEERIQVRRQQINLHKGDSKWSEIVSSTLMERFPGYRSPRGLYSAMARGEA